MMGDREGCNFSDCEEDWTHLSMRAACGTVTTVCADHAEMEMTKARDTFRIFSEVEAL